MSDEKSFDDWADVFEDGELDDLFFSPEIDFADVAQIIEDPNREPTPSELVYGFSNLEADDVSKLTRMWEKLPDEFWVDVLSKLVDANETLIMVDYSAVASVAIKSSNPSVIAKGIELMWEDSSLASLHRLIDFAKNHPTFEVRKAAIQGMVPFILEANYEHIPEHEQQAATQIGCRYPVGRK